MVRKLLIGVLFAFAALLIFSNSAKAITVNDPQIDTVIGTSFPIIVTFAAADVGASQSYRNFTLYYNTTPTTWSKGTLTGISGNTTCSSNVCTNASVGAIGTGSVGLTATWTVSGDVTNSHVIVCYNVSSTGACAGTNSTEFSIDIDNTAPTLTVYPSQGHLYVSNNGTVNVTITSNENLSSMWAVLNGKNYSTFSSTSDTTWKFSVGNLNDGSYTVYARGYDYAQTTPNAATSSLRTVTLNTGAKGGNGGKVISGKFVQEPSKNKNMIIAVIIVIGAIILLSNKKK